MAWSELKYALNSTLGTSEFESLDEIVKNKVSTYSPIRHIQSGVARVGYSNTTVKLSGFSNRNKMIVLVDGVNSYYESVTGHIGVINSISKLTISQNNGLSIDSIETRVSYQVIEFM